MTKFDLIKNIDEYEIIAKSPYGVYILSKTGKKPHYVGRSDNDLKGRILRSVKEKRCSYFWAQETSSPMQAYKLECKYYHKYEEIVVNEIHPDVPDGTNWRCPVEGCEWG
jgi:hypothetical protein